MLATTHTSFRSGKDRCAAWITYPAGDGPHPAVVLVHGFGASRQMGLGQYEQAFAAAGMAVLAFDFRNIGASEGAPRQLVSIRRQRADIEAALAFIHRDARIAADRVALWGTSMGATHVLLTAAEHNELAAAVIQCPVVNTRNAALSSGWGHVGRLTGPITSDLIRAALHLPRRYIPIVGEPATVAMVTVPKAKEGWYGLVPAGTDFDNRVTAATGAQLVTLNASRKAAAITVPLLVCVSDHETLMDPRIAVTAAERAPKGEMIRYPADHFEVYHPPLAARIIADQTAFLARHLGLGEAADA